MIGLTFGSLVFGLVFWVSDNSCLNFEMRSIHVTMMVIVTVTVIVMVTVTVTGLGLLLFCDAV